MRKLSALLLTIALLTSVAFQPVLAQEWHGRGDGYGFHDHGDHWRAGRWFNGFHDGRNGWWWIVDGMWYFYPAPIYPYPDPYTPPTVVIETVPGAPAGAQTYYYCASPAGYYPSVPQCATAWQKVVAAPTTPPVVVAPAPQSPPPQAIVPVGNQHDIDLQQLNAYAAKLQSIDYKDSHVRARLKDLEKQVEAFRQSLYKRDYNAMGMLRDAEDLKKRIDEQRNWLAKHEGAIPPAPLPPGSAVTFPPPMTGAPPPPASLPSGSTVTFPPPPQ